MHADVSALVTKLVAATLAVGVSIGLLSLGAHRYLGIQIPAGVLGTFIGVFLGLLSAAMLRKFRDARAKRGDR